MSSISLEPAARESLHERLLAWYRAACRPLPWRESRDAYRVWVSEVMLQQTRVETVLDYWPRFVERFPTVQALAGAEVEEVLALWSGLGYYSRARQLHAAAAVIRDEHGGTFPMTRQKALTLPGVGPYTAGAVLSIAYGLSEPLVDGNVIRVLSRLFAIEGDPAKGPTKAELWRIADELVPREESAGDWNQALMELGATVCTARSPRCESCPVAESCVALTSGRTEELPHLAARRAPIEVVLCVLLVRRNGRVLLEQRPATGRMAGMWQLPTLEVENSKSERSGLYPAGWPDGAGLEVGKTLGEVRHSITHHAIRAEVRTGELRGTKPGTWRWLRRSEDEARGLTGMARKAIGTKGFHRF